MEVNVISEVSTNEVTFNMAQSNISGEIKKDVNVKKFENLKNTTSRRKLRELQIN